jgi:hypothetical protein
MSLAAKILVLRATRTVRAAQRQRRRQLERELAAYASPADRLELEAILDRYPAGQTGELRTILARQSMQAPVAIPGLTGNPRPA